MRNLIQKTRRIIKLIRLVLWLKRARWVMALILLLSLFALKPYFHQGFPYTHDGENHLARFANYKLAVKEGQLPPRWAPGLLNHYGYPVFNYNYPLANIMSLPLSALKLNYEVSFKLLAALYVVAGLIGSYRLLRAYKLPDKAVLFGLSLYGLSPYLYNIILYRGNIGELAAWGLLPWLLVLVEQIRQAKLDRWQMTVWILVVAAFLLSHNVMVLFTMPLLVIYAGLRLDRNWDRWQDLVLTLIYGGLLSLWFWLPALAEKHLVVLDGAELSRAFAQHFPTWQQLLFSPMQFGFSYPGDVDSLSFSLGWAQLSSVILLSFIVIDRLVRGDGKQGNKFWLTLVGLIWLVVILQLRLTQPIWQVVPFAQFIQFPWRLGMFFSLLSVLAGGYLFSLVGKKTKLVLWLIIFWQLAGLLRHQPVDYFHRLNRDYDAFSQTTSTANENLPVNFSYSQIADWQPTPSILAGEGQIQVDYWKGSDRQYRLYLDEVSAVVEPTARFAGWATTVQPEGSSDWQQVEYIDNPIIAGRISYELEAGSYLVRTRFTQWTWPRLIGNTLSLVTLAAVFINLIIPQLKSRWP